MRALERTRGVDVSLALTGIDGAVSAIGSPGRRSHDSPATRSTEQCCWRAFTIEFAISPVMRRILLPRRSRW